jgi:hypothetical protein
MELFMLFLLVCFGIGMGAPEMSTRRQLWIVMITVLLMTTLYYLNDQLI